MLTIAICALATPLLLAAQRPISLAGRSTVYAPSGMAATSQPLASAAAVDVMQHGGNAINASGRAGARMTREALLARGFKPGSQQGVESVSVPGINSNYDAFGSGIVVPGLGFALHNRGAGFTLTPGLPNTVAPGKRPFHTLIPGFVTGFDDTQAQIPYMTFGLMGGGMQAPGHVQFLINMFVFGMNVQQAIDAARFRHLEGLRETLKR